jgi:glycosyltransferase involved in cell wall biosynthesis
METQNLKIVVIGTCSPHVANHILRIKDEHTSIEVISNGRAHFSGDEPIHLVDFSITKCWNLFVTPRKIKKLIKKINPDVIHIHQANSVAFYSLLANRTLKIPTILTAWGSDILLNPRKNALLKAMVRYTLRKTDFFTADSTYLAQEMRALVPDKQLDITICNFGVAPIKMEVAKKKVIYSNRNHNPLYRIDQVIEGFERFSTTELGKDWKLIVAGSGSETEKLKSMVLEKGMSEKITFVGFVNKEQNFKNYAEATFFASIPMSDATSISLLEAMYYKCIPVLSYLQANAEWVEDGDNGILVKDLSENYFKRALEIDLERSGAKNHTIILEHGTEEVSRKKFRAVLLKAVSR